jgi:hypothetical protein
MRADEVPLNERVEELISSLRGIQKQLNTEIQRAISLHHVIVTSSSNGRKAGNGRTTTRLPVK